MKEKNINMKVLITSYFSPGKGGAEESTYLIAKGLKELGNHVVIASSENYNGIKTYYLKPKTLFRAWQWSIQAKLLASFLIKVIKKEKIDLIHSQEKITTLGSILAGKKSKIPVVTHFRDYWFVCPKSTCLTLNYKNCSVCNYKKMLKYCHESKFLWYTYKWSFIKSSWKLLKKSDVKIAVSNFMKEKLKLIGITENVKILPNPIDINLFENIDDDSVKKIYGLKGIVITFLGTLSYQKGITILMKLIPRILKKKKDVHFLIVGDGPLKTLFQTFIKTKNLNNSVTFTGRLHSQWIPKIYAASDIILFPSIWQEPFGRITIEAMAAGKPIIASNVGGIVDVLEDGKFGFLVNPFNLKQWEERIIELIENEDLRLKMGRMGRRVARKKYRKEVIVKKLMKIYEEII